MLENLCPKLDSVHIIKENDKLVYIETKNILALI